MAMDDLPVIHATLVSIKRDIFILAKFIDKNIRITPTRSTDVYEAIRLVTADVIIMPPTFNPFQAQYYKASYRYASGMLQFLVAQLASARSKADMTNLRTTDAGYEASKAQIRKIAKLAEEIWSGIAKAEDSNSSV